MGGVAAEALTTVFLNLGNAAIFWKKRVEIGPQVGEPGKADWAQA